MMEEQIGERAAEQNADGDGRCKGELVRACLHGFTFGVGC